MKTITIKIHNLKVTRYTTLTNLNVTLARLGQSDGLFTEDEAIKLTTFLKTQPIALAQISDIHSHEAVMIDDETGEMELYTPYTMPFGTGGFKANLSDWCEEYPFDFEVEVLFYEYDEDYESHRSHLESTYKRKRSEKATEIASILSENGCDQDQINEILLEMNLIP